MKMTTRPSAEKLLKSAMTQVAIFDRRSDTPRRNQAIDTCYDSGLPIAHVDAALHAIGMANIVSQRRRVSPR